MYISLSTHVYVGFFLRV